MANPDLAIPHNVAEASPPGLERGLLTSEHEERWLAGKAYNTARAYRRLARSFLSLMAGREPLIDDIRLYLATIKSPGGHNFAIAALKSLCKYLHRNHIWQEDLAHDFDVKRKAYEPKIKGEGYFTADDKRRLFELAQSKRDRAILALLFATGGRRGEIAELEMDDYNRVPGLTYLMLHQAKTGRDCPVSLPRWASLILNEYLAERGDAPGSIFCLTAEGIYFIFKQYCTAIGLPEASPHWCRSTVVVDLKAQGKSNREVREVTGHKSDTMINLYEKRRTPLSERASLSLPDPTSE